MAQTILKSDRKYTFSDYFYLNNPAEEIAAEFDYTLISTFLELPKTLDIPEERLQVLRDNYNKTLPFITLTTEIAKREFLVAPLLVELIKSTNARISVEYPIDVNEKLSGSLDYLIRSQRDLIVIEAKKGDMERGFNQLLTEMIAVDKSDLLDSPEKFYGAITVGELWRFCFLEPATKRIFRDIHTFRVPEDVDEVFSILTGILQVNN